MGRGVKLAWTFPTGEEEEEDSSRRGSETWRSVTTAGKLRVDQGGCSVRGRGEGRGAGERAAQGARPGPRVQPVPGPGSGA